MTDTDDTITEIEIPDDLTKLTKPKLIELLQALTDAPEGIISLGPAADGPTCLDGGPPNGTPVDVDGYAAPFLRWLDPEWSWEPMATTDAGSPFVGAHVDGTVLSLWGRVKADCREIIAVGQVKVADHPAPFTAAVEEMLNHAVWQLGYRVSGGWPNDVDPEPPTSPEPIHLDDPPEGFMAARDARWAILGACTWDKAQADTLWTGAIEAGLIEVAGPWVKASDVADLTMVANPIIVPADDPAEPVEPGWDPSSGEPPPKTLDGEAAATED